MTTDTSVKYFDSTMSGAPSLSGTAGTLISVLDACLVNGFGSVTLNPLVVASNVATATVSTGHGFLDHAVVLIEGATPAGLNGAKRITVTSTTAFTFDATGISDQTATGTITAKMAPVGWTKAYSGTNKAVYARSSSNLTATAMKLRIDDSPTQYPTLIMYEAMTDVDTGTGASSTRYFAKSSAASSTARTWRLFADDYLFYLFANADDSTWPSVMVFGDIDPYKSGDAYHCLLLGHAAANTTSHLYFVDGTTTGAELARSYSQAGGKVASGRYSHRTCQYLGVGDISTPNYADNAIHVWPVQVCEGTTIARGELPGLFCPIHNTLIGDGTRFLHGDRRLFSQMTYSASYRAALDLTGPWR